MDTDNLFKRTVISEIGGIVTTVTPKGIIVSPFSKAKDKNVKDITLSHSYNNYDRYSVGDSVVVVTYKFLRPSTNEDITRFDFLAQYNHETSRHPQYVTDKRVEIETPAEYKARKAREALEAQKAREASRKKDDDDGR